MNFFLFFSIFIFFPKLFFGQQTVELCPWERNTFTYYSSSNSVGSWSWALGPDTISYNNSVTITWVNPGDYNLVVEFKSGCNIPKDVYKIHVIECTEIAIYFPNSFSPNNDGINDRWGPKGIGIVELEWSIWNRFGEMIFKSNDLDKEPEKCNLWDGSLNNSNSFDYIQNDVYVYKANWRGSNGSYGQKIGHIVIVR